MSACHGVSTTGPCMYCGSPRTVCLTCAKDTRPHTHVAKRGSPMAKGLPDTTHPVGNATVSRSEASGRTMRDVPQKSDFTRRFFYCWLCRQRRLFRWEYDCDGGNWHGLVCDHALWSQSQFNAEQKATVGNGNPPVSEASARIPSAAQKDSDTNRLARLAGGASEM